MVSRLKAGLRRCAPQEENIVEAGGLRMNTRERTVTADGGQVDLT